MPVQDDEAGHEDPQAGDLIEMRRGNVMIPKPKSVYLSVECTKCGEKAVIFSHTTTNINCKSCGEVLAEPSGSKAVVLCKILSALDQ